jgi:predicted nucleotidyltransferase
LGIPKEVNDLIGTLVSGVKLRLGKHLVGIYLRGSLATGDFIPATSDIDLLVVTDPAIDQRLFDKLEAFHDQVFESSNPYAKRLEVAYIDRDALKKFRGGLQHPTLEQGERLKMIEHHTNWMLERWVVREFESVLIGPNPKKLIDPITPEEVRQAVTSRLGDWAEWARNEDDPDWILPKSHKAYVIETMCRVLFTSHHGILSSKTDAVEWAIKTLPEPWCDTVERSKAWRTDMTCDPSINSEMREFVLWVTKRVQTTSNAESS